MIDIEAQIRSTLAETAAATVIPAFPGLAGMQSAPGRRIRRRFGTAAVVTGLVLGSGAGVAAAAVAGVLHYPAPSGSFGYGVPGTERTILDAPGPDGSTLRLQIADSRLGGSCSRLSGGPDGIAVGECGRTVSRFGRLELVAESTDATTVGLGRVEFAALVPGATSVRLAFDDGTGTGLPVAQAHTVGWFTDAQSRHRPELIGYDAAGTVVGRTDLISAARQRGLTCRRHC